MISNRLQPASAAQKHTIVLTNINGHQQPRNFRSNSVSGGVSFWQRAEKKNHGSNLEVRDIGSRELSVGSYHSPMINMKHNIEKSSLQNMGQMPYNQIASDNVHRRFKHFQSNKHSLPSSPQRQLSLLHTNHEQQQPQDSNGQYILRQKKIVQNYQNIQPAPKQRFDYSNDQQQNN